MVNQFGQTETTLASILEEFADGVMGGGHNTIKDVLQQDIVRALLGSRRTGDLIVSIRLCIKAWEKSGNALPEGAKSEIDELFAQLQHIRFLRDRTAHYGVQISAENKVIYFRALNRYTVNDLAKTDEILFTIENLDEAFIDLETICRRLGFALGMYKRQDIDPDNPPILPSWRYNSASLIKRAFQFPPFPPPPGPPPRAYWS